MNFQFIHDSKGTLIGIFIPVSDWEQLKKQYATLEQHETRKPTNEQLMGQGEETIQDNRAYSVEQIRQTHPSAYAPWTNEDEYKLKIMYFDGKSIDEIAGALGRNRGAISSRLRKLGIAHIP